MHFQLIFLSLTAVIGFSTCNRVYVHPFNLVAYSKDECEKVQSQNPSAENMLFPPAIESKNNAEEKNVKPQTVLEEDKLKILRNYIVPLIEALSFRGAAKLFKQHTTDSILIPYTDFFRTIVSFYLGASESTSSSLQSFLGIEDPSRSKNCTSKMNGFKVISVLRNIDSLLVSKDSNINTLRTVCIFVSPKVQLSEKFVHALAGSVDNFFVRAVDFTDSTKAVKSISEFLDSKLSEDTKSGLTFIDETANLMYISHVLFKGKVDKSSLIPNHQPFWTEPNKIVLVPMIAVSGIFQFHEDNTRNQLIIKIPLSDNDFLLLVQPINGNTLENIESSMMWVTHLEWGKELSKRYIHLSLPKLKIESSYNIQDVLHNLNLSELLGKDADFNKMSTTSIKVGKVINTVDFVLEESDVDPNDDTNVPETKEEPLDIKLNKPFILALFEGTSKSLLLLGKVVKPTNVI
ncbi:angiotensinogen [Engystomops pustulosus]